MALAKQTVKAGKNIQFFVRSNEKSIIQNIDFEAS